MASGQDLGERVLGQTAALFSARGDTGAVTLLRAVHRLDFEQTGDGFVTETNWHDYYWAAILYVEDVDAPAFTDTIREQLLTVLAEVARQNERPDVDRILVRPVLPEPVEDWRQTLAVASPQRASRQNRITDLTRRRIFDALRLRNTHWEGGLGDVDFLGRIYDLDELPSNDPRFTTAEGDIIQHRFNNDDWDDDWVFTDPRFGLSRGSDETFLRFLSEMLHPVVRSDGPEIEELLELFNEALGRDGYRLITVDNISGYPIYAGHRVPLSITPFAPSLTPEAANTTTRHDVGGSSSQDGAGYEAVRRRARGERKDYQLDRLPLVEGGQAVVFRAVHKTSQTVVAFKRRLSHGDTPTARMRREIDISRVVDGHPHYMPILDANAEEGWIVMPMAEATAAERHEDLKAPEKLLVLVKSLIDVLAVAHRNDWLHRDIKPQNILLLDSNWTLADWGIVRRPRGDTTKAGRTRFSLGTEGFAAPELSIAAHEATHASDIYSIGRVIAWALTGEYPQPNVPLYPPPGPWRTVVRHCTEHDPERRPQSVQNLLQLIDQELAGPPQSLEDQARSLQVRAQSGDQAAVDALLGLAVDHPERYDLYLHAVAELQPAQAAMAMQRNRQQATELLKAMTAHVDGDGVRRVQFFEAARAVIWLHMEYAGCSSSKQPVL